MVASRRLFIVFELNSNEDCEGKQAQPPDHAVKMTDFRSQRGIRRKVQGSRLEVVQRVSAVRMG